MNIEAQVKFESKNFESLKKLTFIKKQILDSKID